MSPQSQAHQAYSQAFHTVSKTRQVVMLYDGLIRFVKQARQAIEENRIEDRFKLLMRCSDIVLGLQSSLDFDNGDQVARVLYDFYSSVDSRLLAIQRSNDVSELDNLLTELKEMRDAWSDIDGQATEDNAATQAAAPQAYAAPQPAPQTQEESSSSGSAAPFGNDITV